MLSVLPIFVLTLFIFIIKYRYYWLLFYLYNLILLSFGLAYKVVDFVMEFSHMHICTQTHHSLFLFLPSRSLASPTVPFSPQIFPIVAVLSPFLCSPSVLQDCLFSVFICLSMCLVRTQAMCTTCISGVPAGRRGIHAVVSPSHAIGTGNQAVVL